MDGTSVWDSVITLRMATDLLSAMVITRGIPGPPAFILLMAILLITVATHGLTIHGDITRDGEDGVTTTTPGTADTLVAETADLVHQPPC